MKAGAFNLIGKKFGLAKLGKSTHYYLIDAENAEKVKAACAAIDQPVYQIGAVVEGEKKVVIDQTCEL